MLIYNIMGHLSLGRAIRVSIDKEHSEGECADICALIAERARKLRHIPEQSLSSLKKKLRRAARLTKDDGIRRALAEIDEGRLERLCEDISPLHAYLIENDTVYLQSDNRTRETMRKRIVAFAALHHLTFEQAAKVVDRMPKVRRPGRYALPTAAVAMTLSLFPCLCGAPLGVAFLILPITFESVSSAIYRVERDLLPIEYLPCLKEPPQKVSPLRLVLCAMLSEHRTAVRELCELYLSNSSANAVYILFLDLPDSGVSEDEHDRAQISAAADEINELCARYGEKFALIVRRREYDPHTGTYIGRCEQRDPAVDLARFFLGRRSVISLEAGKSESIEGAERVLLTGGDCRFPRAGVDRILSLIHHPDNRDFGGFYIGKTDVGAISGGKRFSRLRICRGGSAFVFCPDVLGLVIPPEPTVNDPFAVKKLRCAYVGQIKLCGASTSSPRSYFSSIYEGAREHLGTLAAELSAGKLSKLRTAAAAKACVRDALPLCLLASMPLCARLYSSGKSAAAVALFAVVSLISVLPIVHSVIFAVKKRRDGHFCASDILYSVLAELFRISALPMAALCATIGATYGMVGAHRREKKPKSVYKLAVTAEIASVLAAYLLFIASASKVFLPCVLIGTLMLAVMPMIIILDKDAGR